MDFENLFNMNDIKMYTIKCPSCASEYEVVIDDAVPNKGINYCVSCGDDISQHIPKPEPLAVDIKAEIVEEDKDF